MSSIEQEEEIATVVIESASQSFKLPTSAITSLHPKADTAATQSLKNNSKKKHIIAVVGLFLLILMLCLGIYFIYFSKHSNKTDSIITTVEQFINRNMTVTDVPVKEVDSSTKE